MLRRLSFERKKNPSEPGEEPKASKVGAIVQKGGALVQKGGTVAVEKGSAMVQKGGTMLRKLSFNRNKKPKVSKLPKADEGVASLGVPKEPTTLEQPSSSFTVEIPTEALPTMQDDEVMKYVEELEQASASRQPSESAAEEPAAQSEPEEPMEEPAVESLPAPTVAEVAHVEAAEKLSPAVEPAIEEPAVEIAVEEEEVVAEVDAPFDDCLEISAEIVQRAICAAIVAVEADEAEQRAMALAAEAGIEEGIEEGREVTPTKPLAPSPMPMDAKSFTPQSAEKLLPRDGSPQTIGSPFSELIKSPVPPMGLPISAEMELTIEPAPKPPSDLCTALRVCLAGA